MRPDEPPTFATGQRAVNQKRRTGAESRDSRSPCPIRVPVRWRPLVDRGISIAYGSRQFVQLTSGAGSGSTVPRAGHRPIRGVWSSDPADDSLSNHEVSDEQVDRADGRLRTWISDELPGPHRPLAG